MGRYAAEHASALVDFLDAGAAVTFTRTTGGTYDQTTDTWTAPAVVSSITGAAIQVKPDTIKYQAMGLIQTEAPTLTFVPTTYGDTPSLDDKVSWGGVEYTVQSVQPVDPDGVAILHKVIVSR